MKNVAIIFGVIIGYCLASDNNIKSYVHELNERFLEFSNDGHWFVEFYAPWCGHCQKLHPIWEQAAITLSEKAPNIRVGRLDCTRFPNIASELSIQGYPTIKYFRDGVQYSYEGERSHEALVEYGRRLEGPPVRLLSSANIFLHYFEEHKRKGGFFVFVAQPDDDSNLKAEFFNISKEMFTKATFAFISPENLPQEFSVANIPTVIAVHDNTYFDFLTDHRKNLLKWIESERWPYMPLLSYGNLYDIGLCCDNLLVIVVSDFVEKTKSDSPIKKFHDLAKSVAKGYSKEKFQFVWTDGNELATSILLRSIPAPNLFVFNVSSYEYFLPDDPIPRMTKESLKLFLENIVADKITAFGGKGIIQRLKRAFYDAYSTVYGMFSAQPLLSCCLFGLPLGIFSIICYTLCSADMSSTDDRDEIYRDSDEYDESDFDQNSTRNTVHEVEEHDKVD